MGIQWLFGTRESRYRPGRSVLSTRRDLEVYSYLAYEPMFQRGWCVAGEVQSFQYKVMNANIIYHVRSRPSHESSRVFSVECFAKSSQSEVAGAAIFGSYIFLIFFDDELPNPQPGASNEFPSRIQPMTGLCATKYVDLLRRHLHLRAARFTVKGGWIFFHVLVLYCNFKRGHALYHPCLYHILIYSVLWYTDICIV